MAEPRVTSADDPASAYLNTLRSTLPRSVVEELAGGIADAIEHHRAAGLPEPMAVRAALAEFGDAHLVADAFTATGVPRRAARRLLLTGPVVGACWAAVVILGKAWSWPVPVFVPLVFGSVLAGSIAALAIAGRIRHFRRSRLATVTGCVGVLGIDIAVPAVMALVAPGLSPALLLAVAASGTRATYAFSAVRRMRMR